MLSFSLYLLSESYLESLLKTDNSLHLWVKLALID